MEIDEDQMEVMVESAGHTGWDASPSGDTYSLVASLLSPSQPPRTKQQLALHWNTGTASIFWWAILDKGVHELVAL